MIALLLPVGALRAEIVINEIMYHPESNIVGDEYIELFNTGPGSVDVSNWYFDGVAFTFPASSPLVAAGEYVVLVSDPARFAATYPSAPALPPDRTYTLELSDNGERLGLFNASAVLIDEVFYSDRGQWPVTPDGLDPSVSLELVDPDEENSNPRNWRASLVAGGTPGSIISVDSDGLPPWIEGVAHTIQPQPSDPIVVTATVLDAATVELSYAIDFGAEVTVPMLDDGNSGDGAPGDGTYGMDNPGNAIPGQPAGTLVRYRIGATGATGSMSYPRDDDTVNYDGTAVIDPSLSSGLPILQWFIDTTPGGPYDRATCLGTVPTCHGLDDMTEPAVLYYDGKLYDNIEVRLRGQSARQRPKPPWKFFFRQGHNFEAPGLIERAVDTFNLQANYADKSHLREILAWETVRDSGHPWLQALPVRVERNGQFFGLFTYLEAPESDWVSRMRLDPEAARYKAFDDCRARGSEAELESLYEKKSRLDEPYTDLFDFTTDVNQSATEQQIRSYIFDNLDLPSWINYIAVNTVLHNNDHVAKNYFLYRDTLGSGRWAAHFWDMDLTLGRNFVTGPGVLNDMIWADDDAVAGYPSDRSPSHPLFGTFSRKTIGGAWNRCIERVLLLDEVREMYFRRLRTTMETFLADGHYENRIDELLPLIAPEAALDVVQWGQYGVAQDAGSAADMIKNEYLNDRRVHLFTTHSVCDIPQAQSADPPVVINEIMYQPAGGLPTADHEYLELHNTSVTEAVDISGWRIDGVALNIPPGTVIPAGGFALFVKNDAIFRQTYGGGKFVAAVYSGSLSDIGESIVLRNRFGGIVSAVTYENIAPWPPAAAGGGSSLELRDPTKDAGKVVNWASSVGVGTPGGANSTLASTPDVPDLFINEVLSVNASINQDELGEFDPWIELYNPTSTTVDLGTLNGGLYLSDDFAVTDKWPIPAGTTLCGGCWAIFWADNETTDNPATHTNFALSSGGGSVALFADDGTLVDYLNYGPLAADRSYGRFPDGGADQRIFIIVTADAANDVPLSPLILNEYNAVDPTQFLDNSNTDSFFGRVLGNGGDWFELVVASDHLDVRGWELAWSDDTAGAGETTGSLFFSMDPLWSDLRAGTVITVAEDQPDDISYDPVLDDWWINVRASDSGSGLYITASFLQRSTSMWIH